MYDGDSEELPPSLGSDTSSDDESSSIDDHEEVEQKKRKYTYAEEIIIDPGLINPNPDPTLSSRICRTY